MKRCALESDLIGLRHGGSSGGTGIATYYAGSGPVKDVEFDVGASSYQRCIGMGSRPSAPLVSDLKPASAASEANTASTRASIISLLRTDW